MGLSRNLFLGFVKLHIVYPADREPVYGLWLIEELARHAYELSSGTLCPALHNLEDEGLLTSEDPIIGGKRRRCYVSTGRGRNALNEAQKRAVELLEEIRDASAET